METNNVEMTPEVVETGKVIECNGFVGAVMLVGAALAWGHVIVVPGLKWAKAKISNLRQPKLQIVEDEEE